MKKKLFALFIIALFALPSFTATAQDGPSSLNGYNDGVYDKIHLPERIPIPFEYLREADIMWSKIVWRRIDLREKMNLPLYYPEIEMWNERRKSLMGLILYGIENEGLKAYNPSDPMNEFSQEMTFTEIKDRMGGGNDTITVPDEETGEMIEKVFEGEVKPYDVKQYIVKELWFFDKQRSVLEVRIIGLCPIREFFKEEDVDMEDVKLQKVCWIYYPEARDLFASYEVFNPQNDAERRTFDDIFVNRLFSSYITRESNVYNNRAIGEYTIGIESMLEAERIKEKIFNFEQDLWEY